MTTKRMTTEQMVKKCFCEVCDFRAECQAADGECSHDSDYARAARRFVRMENAQKAERKWDTFKKSCRTTERKALT